MADMEIDKKHRIITVFDGSSYDSSVEDYLLEKYPNYQIVVDYRKRSQTTTKGKKNQTVQQKKKDEEVICCKGIEFQINKGVLKKVTGTADTISVPEEVHTINAKTFSANCSIRKVIIPDTVKKLSSSVFYNCKDLEEAELPGHLTELPDSLFDGCKKLKTVRIPTGVTVIGSDCFFNCQSLAEIILPDGLKTIKSLAFANCFSLTEIRFPDSLTDIMSDAFCCSGLEKLDLPQSIQSIKGFQYLGNRYWISGSSTQYKIAERPDFDPQKQTGIVSLKIPDSITEVDGFGGNELLEKVEFPRKMKTVRGFDKCIRLVKVNLPDTVREIGSYCFAGCTSLEEINLPGNLKEIGNCAFRDCKELRLESLPAGIKKLGERVFAGCDRMTSITFEGGFPEFNSSSRIKEEQLAGKDVIFEGCAPGFTVKSVVGFQTQENFSIESTCYPTEITLKDLAFMALCKSAKSADWKVRIKNMISAEQAKEVFSLMAKILQAGEIKVDKTVTASANYMVEQYGAYADKEDCRIIQEMTR